jgi:hypothetical protein
MVRIHDGLLRHQVTTPVSLGKKYTFSLEVSGRGPGGEEEHLLLIQPCSLLTEWALIGAMLFVQLQKDKMSRVRSRIES